MIDFDHCFRKLTVKKLDHSEELEPFAWQRELFARMTRGELPPACDIPTGLGKTYVILIWLLALADNLLRRDSQRTIPLRLVYVVDRRVIVDQATSEAERIVKNLKELAKTDERIGEVYDALKRAAFSNDEDVVALSTLRGEHADNREWLLDPSRPAIIVGTIDMIGSRLLFSAYGGVGPSYKALQAGLFGQDSLIVVDEAHLSPAFMRTLRAIDAKVNRKSSIKPFSVMSLSATLSHEEGEASKPFTLEDHARQDLVNASDRLNAEKRVEWHSYEVPESAKQGKKKDGSNDEEFQAEEMARVAAQYKDSPVSVLIFGKTVNLVKRIVERLKTVERIGDEQILLMIGGMRGVERDGLVDHPVFKRFSPHRKREEQERASFLVATSCAEVGVDLDADFAVCDLTSADSFIQRLGRVNRFGKTSSVVTVVFNRELTDQKAEAVETLRTLRDHADGDGLNASPLALRGIKFGASCFEPSPVCPSLDSARLDDWSMTSLRQDEFRRPLVSYWLRGVVENHTSETALCWRAEMSLTEDKKLLESMIKTARINSRECARESTSRAVRTLRAINERHSDKLAVLIDASGNYQCLTIGDLVGSEENKKGDKDRTLYDRLRFATVVLPCEVGGLDKEGITVEDAKELIPVDDVFEKARVRKTASGELESEWLRVLLTETETETTARYIGRGDEREVFKNFETAIREISLRENKRQFAQIELQKPSEDESEDEEGAKTEGQTLVYFVARRSPARYLPSEGENNDESASISFIREVTLESHNAKVGEYAESLARKLNLGDELIAALRIAGEWHDKGKAREDWQRDVIGNRDYPAKVLAKSGGNGFKSKRIGYRHEFGSVIEAEEDEQLQTHPSRDLILHLIATHHGFARPHFPPRAFDKDSPLELNDQTAERAMLRFARLQIEYGWWQLAYLEAILKAADALASRDQSER